MRSATEDYFDISRHDRVEVWAHEGAVWLSLENRDDRVALKLTTSDARDIAESISRRVGDALLQERKP